MLSPVRDTVAPSAAVHSFGRELQKPHHTKFITLSSIPSHIMLDLAAGGGNTSLSNCSGSSWRSGAQAPYRSRLGWSAGALDHVLSPHIGSFHLYITGECEALPFSTKSSHFATALPLLQSPSFPSQNVPQSPSGRSSHEDLKNPTRKYTLGSSGHLLSTKPAHNPLPLSSPHPSTATSASKMHSTTCPPSSHFDLTRSKSAAWCAGQRIISG